MLLVNWFQLTTPAPLFWSTSGKFLIFRLHLMLNNLFLRLFFCLLKCLNTPEKKRSLVQRQFSTCLRVFFLCVCSTLRQRADPVYSPPLQISGLCWRLKVYPVSFIYRRVHGRAIAGKLIVLRLFSRMGMGWSVETTCPSSWNCLLVSLKHLSIRKKNLTYHILNNRKPPA